jgi:hypothetical protein
VLGIFFHGSVVHVKLIESMKFNSWRMNKILIFAMLFTRHGHEHDTHAALCTSNMVWVMRPGAHCTPGADRPITITPLPTQKAQSLKNNFN